MLYGKVAKIEKKNDIKTKLLNILGNKATPTDILYGDEKSLTKKIKEHGLEGKLTGGASGVDDNAIETKDVDKIDSEDIVDTQDNIIKIKSTHAQIAPSENSIDKKGSVNSNLENNTKKENILSENFKNSNQNNKFENKKDNNSVKNNASTTQNIQKSNNKENNVKQIDEKAYRNILLNVLGNAITPAMILYAPIKKLEQAAKDSGLTDKLNQEKNKVKQKGVEFAIGENYQDFEHNAAKIVAGKDGAGMLDLAHGINMNDRNYIKDTISLDNYNDLKVASDREYLKEKISQQFKDYNFDIDKIKGYYFKSNSEPSQRLAENKDFKDMIKNHKKEILENGEFKAEFKKYGRWGLLQKNNFHNAIGKADFRNIYQDKDGNLHVKMYDTYDFNKGENNLLIKAGVNQMEKGNLKPFFTIHDIIIPKEKLNEIWK